MSTSSFPLYRDRYLPAMTMKQIAALPDKAWAPVILATGAIEQHGPHLPVAVDSFLGQVWVQSIHQQATPDISFYVAPPIPIGKSNEHVGFPGTLYISKQTLRNLVKAVARQVHAWGFRQLVILNTHGGNSAVLQYTLREIRAELGLRAGSLNAQVKLDLSAQESTYGFHANEVESALLAALAPEYTHMERAVCHYPASIDDPGELRPECAPATYSWASQDISPSGIMGDAPAGTPEKGHLWHGQYTEAMVKALAALCEEGRKRV
jgi:creatinine amidohydrolase